MPDDITQLGKLAIPVGRRGVVFGGEPDQHVLSLEWTSGLEFGPCSVCESSKRGGGVRLYTAVGQTLGTELRTSQLWGSSHELGSVIHV